MLDATVYVFNAESDERECLGEYAGREEDVVQYVTGDGSVRYAPSDCVSLRRISGNRALRMDNGATVSDWLGTAAVAAGVARMYLHDVRNGVSGAHRLILARESLVQATAEVDAILRRLAQSDAQ